jgi:N-methylhydantoinase A/oxoprolinase/acetone carboxylase beta subunit
VDAGGALRVGPRSAGANPGPVCYGSGTELTVTDANLLLGRLDEAFFLGGRMRLDRDRVQRTALEAAARIGVTTIELAEGIVRVANANMERAIRVVSVERGFDVRDFVLVAFGGAGGMHACEIASTLEIETIVVPRYAGVLSALGMLVADVTRDYSQTILRPSDELSSDAIDAVFAPLAARAHAELAAEGFVPDDVQIARTLDVRYVGQSYEITVPFTPDYRDAFDLAHARLYGYCNRARRTELVNIRIAATGITVKPELPRSARQGRSPGRPVRTSRARFNGETVDTRFYRWEDLPPGSGAEGPAVVAGGQATAVIPPGFAFDIDEFGNLVATHTTGARGAPVTELASAADAQLTHHAHQPD